MPFVISDKSFHSETQPFPLDTAILYTNYFYFTSGLNKKFIIHLQLTFVEFNSRDRDNISHTQRKSTHLCECFFLEEPNGLDAAFFSTHSILKPSQDPTLNFELDPELNQLTI